MVHVLIVPAFYPSDMNKLSGIFIKEQCEALAGYGLDVGVIYPDFASLRRISLKNFWRRRFQIKSSIDLSVKTVRQLGWRIPKSREWQEEFWVKSIIRLLKRYIRNFGEPDLIHAHFIRRAGYAAARIKEEFDIPFVVTAHWGGFSNRMIKLLGEDSIAEFEIPLIRNVIAKSEFILPVSKSLLPKLKSYYPMSEHIEVVPNMVDTSFFVPNQDLVDKDHFVFVTISGERPVKNLDYLLRAFSLIIEKIPTARLKIIGCNPDFDFLNKMRALGLSEHLEIMGSLPRHLLLIELQSSHVLVVSSLCESFGLSVIESFSVGNPVISTKCGGPEDLVKDINGILCSINDLKEFAAAMIEISEKYSDYSHQVIRTDVIKNFGRLAVCKKIVFYYEIAIGNFMEEKSN